MRLYLIPYVISLYKNLFNIINITKHCKNNQFISTNFNLLKYIIVFISYIIDHYSENKPDPIHNLSSKYSLMNSCSFLFCVSHFNMSQKSYNILVLYNSCLYDSKLSTAFLTASDPHPKFNIILVSNQCNSNNLFSLTNFNTSVTFVRNTLPSDCFCKQMLISGLLHLH